MQSIKIGDRMVGNNYPCYVIAEAGVNHNGSVDRAAELIKHAADAGADAVKFQTFKTEAVVTTSTPKATYQAKNDNTSNTQFEMLSQLELPYEAFRELKSYANALSIDFISTAFDEESLDLVVGLEPPCLKWPSGEIDNVPLLRRAAKTKLPIILSTGMATLGDIELALETLNNCGCNDIVILQCVSTYPAKPSDLNLRAIETIEKAFQRPTGLSDHSLGIAAPLAARALGMCTLEKHFTFDRNAVGPDHKASLEPRELRQMIGMLRDIENALGDGVKVVQDSEKETRTIARRSLHASRDIAAGETITEDALVSLRPGSGISPSHIDDVIDRKATFAIKRGQLLEWQAVR